MKGLTDWNDYRERLSMDDDLERRIRILTHETKYTLTERMDGNFIHKGKSQRLFFSLCIRIK